MSTGGLASVLLVAVLLVPSSLRAQPAPAPEAPETPETPPAAGLAYDAVDYSTVRIFSVGTVGTESFDVGGRKIHVADPRSGHGTGFAVGAYGLILTAHHVVDGARHVVVRLPGKGGFFGARVVYADKDADIALLDVEAEVPALALARDVQLRVRQPVFAIGYPIDPTRMQPQSARGIVAGQLDDGTLQLDMALNPGNSGGPLLDEENRVVGMVVARGDVGAGVQGIGFAVPSEKLTAAIAEAQRRLTAGQVAELTERDRLGAVVVDELIQQGALHEIRKSADLPGGLASADLDTALDALTGRIDDADLLVYVAGSLWNGALALEVGGVRTIGKTTLADADALALAGRLRDSAIEACQRAVKLDASVRRRSPFVALALQSTEEAPPDAPPPATFSARPSFEYSLRFLPHYRVNPTGRSGWGWGMATSAALRPTHGKRVQLAPVFGAALGTVWLDGDTPSETIMHSFLVGEIGVVIRRGTPSKHVAITAAYTPGFYTSSVDGGDEVAEASEFTFMHFRGAAGVRIGRFQIGTGIRLLSGPTFWLEPVFVEGTF